MDVAWIAAQFPDLSGLAPLAQGGQKVVFSATHPSEGDVVLKLLLRVSGEDRLEREVLAGELIVCPRVPRIFETSALQTPLGPCVWLRERRVAGVTLRVMLRGGPLDMTALLALGSQLLEALEAAESKRIVHRDIKPENVMVDVQGDYWLLDFGLSRHLDLESLTATQHHFGVGTWGYSAPEQMKNRKREIDSRADLFALGVLIYECATGRNPFIDGARDGLEVLRRVERQPLPPLRVAYDRNGELRDFVAALTQKYPSQRPDSVRQAVQWFNDVRVALISQTF
ncbi:MAG: serine/threonine-protein kinase [Lysobacterales bacterium]